MPNWVALSRTHHADNRYIPRKGYTFAHQQMVSPVLMAELGKLLPHYVLAFVKQNEGCLPVALLGLNEQDNLYLNHDGRWLASYVPANLRGYPFTLVYDGESRNVLCVDRDVLTESAEEGELLFENDGELAESVRQSMSFLEQCEKNRRVTLAASSVLQESEVIVPWPLEVERGEEQPPVRVEGLFRVDEKALNQLPADKFADLRQSGALGLAYAQLFSVHQLDQLKQRDLYQQRVQEQQTPATSPFGDYGDDELTFDFGD